MEKLDHVADTQQRGWQPRQSLGALEDPRRDQRRTDRGRRHLGDHQPPRASRGTSADRGVLPNSARKALPGTPWRWRPCPRLTAVLCERNTGQHPRHTHTPHEPPSTTAYFRIPSGSKTHLSARLSPRKRHTNKTGAVLSSLWC